MKSLFTTWVGMALAAAWLMAAGCATTNEPPLPENYAGATVQIKKWVPLGTAATDAKRIMQQHGFTCTLERNTRLSAEIVTDDLYCELVWPATRSLEVPQRRWQAFLFLKNDKVADFSVATVLVGR